MGKPIERHFLSKIEKASHGLRRNRNKRIFTAVRYISPEDITIENYIRKRPIALFNPGAFENHGKLYIFPRLVFDYYNYTSSIGMFSLDFKELESVSPMKCDILLWPDHLWEFLGCEDPRIHFSKSKIRILYTGKGYYYDGDTKRRRDVLSLAEMDENFNLIRKTFFKIRYENTVFIPEYMKDSAFISSASGFTILTRPEFGGIKACWRGKVDLENAELSEMELVMKPEEWEERVGWSTNAVKISSDEYLVGWHAVLKSDLSYRNGIAKVNSHGELLAISDYLLFPNGLVEEYGDRAQVIFGDGLILYEDTLFWIGGISDYAIGIFSAKLSDVLDELREI